MKVRKLGLLLVWVIVASLHASDSSAQSIGEVRERVNAGTVGVIAGSLSSTEARISADLSEVLTEPGQLRVVTVLGRGAVQNVEDLLFLKGVDVGLISANVLDHMERRGLHKNIKRQIHYITKLYNEEVHILAAKRVSSLEQLRGQAVVLGTLGSGSNLTATILLESLGIEVLPVAAKDERSALQMLKSGTAIGWVHVAGKPNGIVLELTEEDDLHLLTLPKRSLELLSAYLPSQLTAEDYPNLIASGQRVDTIGTGTVMVAYNWPSNTERYEKVARFVRTFFTAVSKGSFGKPERHPKWREINLATSVAGWTRFRAAEQWLAETRPTPAGLSQGAGDRRAEEKRLSEARIHRALTTGSLEGLNPQEVEEVNAIIRKSIEKYLQEQQRQ